MYTCNKENKQTNKQQWPINFSYHQNKKKKMSLTIIRTTTIIIMIIKKA